MPDLLHELIHVSANHLPDQPALIDKRGSYSYSDLSSRVSQCASGLIATGLNKRDRVGIFLQKGIEAVEFIFAIFEAGGIAIPINPVLKPAQVGHILRDSGAKFVVTTTDRLEAIKTEVNRCPAIANVILTDAQQDSVKTTGPVHITTSEELFSDSTAARPCVIDADIATLLYTSGSTGKPKGVVLTHRNMTAGAKSVATYLKNSQEDKILAVLPLSFDAGFSQLTTAFYSGATAVLHDFFLPRDIIRIAEQHNITGITGVPPLWSKLADLDWPPSIRAGLRYFANTGGKMPRPLLQKLRDIFVSASPFLMYGLTEAFRSTYLPPDQIDRRPDSIGKAIPNAEILVVNAQGELCNQGEPGELVHRGALVSQGYWNDPDKTELRFRPAPEHMQEISRREIAVWSGDTVVADEDGFLYFVGRQDDMIKSSGYRISPTEVEEVLYASGVVSEAAAIGITAGAIGEKVLAILVAKNSETQDTNRILEFCRSEMPTYMVPSDIHWAEELPRTPNGKIDRKRLALKFNAGEAK